MKTENAVIAIELLLVGLFACSHMHAAEPSAPSAEPEESKAYPNNVSLVVAEAVPGRHVADPQVLASYSFVNGRFTRREEILTTPNREAHFEFDGNHMYLNRYAVTRWGDVVDIDKHAVLHKSNGEVLVTCEDNSLILYRSNDRCFYRYEFRTQQHSRLNDLGKWALLVKSWNLSDVNALSPDGAKSVVEGVPELLLTLKNLWLPTSKDLMRLTSVGGTLTLCTLDGATKKLAEGFRNEQSLISSSFGQVPVLWLDNERVLTQKSNGKLVSLRMDGTVEPVVNIHVPDLQVGPASFSRDPAGRIIYNCGESYIIDPNMKQSARLVWAKRGHGFETELDKWPATELAIRYQGKEIARDMFDGKTAKTIAGYLAVAPVETDGGCPPQVHVWNAHTKTWLVLPLGGPLLNIIGWAEKLPK